jgi:gamma-glutamyltranspeptidase / glutathione hydrolase
MSQQTRYRQIRGSSAAIVTGHAASTDVASYILRRGGNAIDAAIGAAAALAVVRPHMCGLGADGFFLIYDAKSRKVHALNAAGPAPAKANVQMFASGFPKRGACLSSVPGIVAGWGEAHSRFGRLPWSEIISPAADLAERGFPVYRSYMQWLQKFEAHYAADPVCSSVFFPNGRIPQPGENLRQPALAGALKTLAKNGARDFYEGSIAASIASFMETADGLITAQDLAQFRPSWSDPVTSTYRGCVVNSQPPTSQGWMLPLMAGVLDGLDIAALEYGSKELTSTLVEVVRSAFKERNDKFGDPKFVPFSVEERLSQQRMEQIRRSVAPGMAEASAVAHGGDTTSLSVVDADGNGVSMIQSLWVDAGVMTPDTGIIFNGRLGSCSNVPGHPNEIAGGKTPTHTMHTYMVTRGNQLYFLGGTPGGHSQVQTNLQVIVNTLDFKMEPQAAVEAPRFLVGGAMEASALATVFIEGRISREAEDLLTRRGSQVVRMPDWAMDWVEGVSLGTVGSEKMISIDQQSGMRSIGVDPRRDAHGTAW